MALKGPCCLPLRSPPRVSASDRCARLTPCIPWPPAYLDDLLDDAPRKNGWPLAETVGDATPYCLQHLLGRAVWSTDAARDALYAYVTEHLGDPGGVAVVDGTG